MSIIEKSIKDERLLRLIQKMLGAGYIENGVRNKPGHGIPSIGTPQGTRCDCTHYSATPSASG